MKKALMSAVVAMVLSSVWSAEELQTLGLPTIDDIRVDVLVSSHWGQKSDTGYSNTGNPCFNYATPNHYPCGCSATPMAQLCWYWRYPASIKSATSRCKVDGAEVSLAYGGKYDYDAMPAVTTGGVDEPRLQRRADRQGQECQPLHLLLFAADSDLPRIPLARVVR